MKAVALALVQFTFVFALYHAAIYPALLWIFGSGKSRRAPPQGGPSPSITLIVPAHNEERVIAAKIHNCARLSYPGSLCILIVLDGCTDETELVATSAIASLDFGQRSRIRLEASAQNRGKIATLNEAISSARTDLVALSDASAMLPANALERAATEFSDERLGFVSGAYVIAKEGKPAETTYWTYQRSIKRLEASLGGPIGAHGAFYLFRRRLFEPLEHDTINDDMILPGRILVKGYRGSYLEDIVIQEIETTSEIQEIRRRMRIGAGNLQQSLRLWRLADPRRGAVCFLFISGKGLRGVLPIFTALSAPAVLYLAWQGSVLFATILLAATVAGAFAMLGRGRGMSKIRYFVFGYLATCAGAMFFLMRQHGELWSLSSRSKGHSKSLTGV